MSNAHDKFSDADQEGQDEHEQSITNETNSTFLVLGIVFTVLGISTTPAFYAVGIVFICVYLSSMHSASKGSSESPEDNGQ
jgi:hypothetical protein